MESRRDPSGEAAGELAFGEAGSWGEDTQTVVDDSEAESGERSLGDCEDMTVSA